jgi:hypothetical protein
LQIGNANDAKSLVRKYIVGTRSRHGKITSITIDQEPERPDDKGMWTIKGAYVTEEGGKEQFNASVTSRGEVIMLNPHPPENPSGKQPSKPSRRGRT